MKRACVFTEEPVLAYGVQAVLGDVDSWATIVATTPAELFTKLKSKENVDLVLIDFDSANFNLVTDIGRCLPDCKVVLWVYNILIETAFQAMRLGVTGILRKTESIESLIECLETVAAGNPWMDRALASAVRESRCIRLTTREGQLVTLISEGLKNKEIAEALCISEATVRVYMSSLFRKLGVKDRYELALYGLKNMVGSHAGSGPAGIQSQQPLSLMISKPVATEKGVRHFPPAVGFSPRRAKVM